MTAGEVRCIMNFELFVIYPFLIISGACIGSFLNVVVSRLPFKGEFLSNKRSRCPQCGHAIKPYDLIPVISWFVLGGRCRSCNARISFRYPFVELMGAFLFVFSYRHFGLEYSSLLAFGVTVVLLAISFIDYDTQEIPDSLIIVIALFAIAAIWVFPEVSLLDRVIGVATISVPMLIVTLLINGAFGGGDIKLIAACGFLLGWQATLLAFFFALILGGSFAVFLILSGRRERGEHMVFGPAICAGVAVSLFYGNEIISWYLQMFMIY